jgi:hypothetical protein
MSRAVQLASEARAISDAAFEQGNRPCRVPRCANYATAKGLCDLHRREKERKRSAERRGGYVRGPMKEVTDARDSDPNYRPTKHTKIERESGGGDLLLESGDRFLLEGDQGAGDTE